MTVLQVHTSHNGMEAMHDSDNIIPPKSTAPASIVPFSKAPSSMSSSSGSSAVLAGKHSGSASKTTASSFASQVRRPVPDWALQQGVALRRGPLRLHFIMLFVG